MKRHESPKGLRGICQLCRFAKYSALHPNLLGLGAYSFMGFEGCWLGGLVASGLATLKGSWMEEVLLDYGPV